MKNLITSLILTLFISGVSVAQKHGEFEFTPEQEVSITIKKLTLALDLTNSQQQKLTPILLKGKTFKDSLTTLEKPTTSEEAFVRINYVLDQKIALQDEIKDVLRSSQYDTWKEIQMRKGEKKPDVKKEAPQASKRKKKKKKK